MKRACQFCDKAILSSDSDAQQMFEITNNQIMKLNLLLSKNTKNESITERLRESAFFKGVGNASVVPEVLKRTYPAMTLEKLEVKR